MKQKRILVIRPDRVGDVVLTTPLIRALRISFPDSFLAVMVSKTTAPLLYNNPHINQLIIDDPQEEHSGKKGFWSQVQLLRSLQFTHGLMPLPRERHAWMMMLAGIRTRIGVGTKLYQVLTATKTVSRNKYIPLRHEADYVMDLGRKIGITTDKLKSELFITNEELQNAKNILLENGFTFRQPIIGINPSSSNSAPNWKPQKYMQLIEKVNTLGQIFVNAGPNNDALANIFRELKNVFVYTSPNLRELIAIISYLKLLVTSSTGTLHIASALNIPSVALFCPLTACSPKLWGPLNENHYIALPPEGYCQHRCAVDPKKCTLDEISVESIASIVASHLQ